MSLTIQRSKRVFATALAAGSLLLASAAPAAMAQDSSTKGGYSKQGPSIQGQVQGEGTSGGVTPKRESGNTPAVAAEAPQKASSGTLPFTGFEASLVFAAGLGLAALGFGLRRVSRPTA